LNSRGQFSIIAALLVAVILIATVIVTYSTIRSSQVKDQPPIQSAIDETNFALKQILGFTVGYYGSILQVTGNSSYAKTLAIDYLQSGLVNIGNMHPDWGISFNVSKSDLYTYWFTNTSYSSGNLAVKYNLTGLGISGITYETSCKLSVSVMNTVGNQATLNITKDEDEPVINLGRSNFKFYRYETANSTWGLTKPSTEPIAYANGTYQIDIPSGIDPYSYVVQVEDPRGIVVVASSFSQYICAMNWIPNEGSKYAVVGSTPEILGPSDANYTTVGKSATCEASKYQGGTAIIRQVYFNISYYGSVSGTLEWYYRLDGGAWNKIEDLPQGGTATSPLTRGHNATGLGPSWTWTNLNTTDIRFMNNDNGPAENAYVDAIHVTVLVQVAGNYSTIPNSILSVELLQNGTMRWLGQNLALAAQAKPIPPIPVKSIHVNQTVNGVSREVPFQIEDWASDYRIPLGLTNNASVFSSRTMLVFLATPNVSQVTIWWNGSDTATQTPYAFTNRYFTGDNPSSGRLTNGILTLQFGSGFLVDSTVGTSTCNAKFMRINNEDSVYGSSLAYVITGGIVRDIIHQEAEWNDGANNCPNLYAHIVLTLPANATYYTYQLRLMFVQSQKNRTITEIRPIRTVTSPTSLPQTENGTTNGVPNVSNNIGSFYNLSAPYWAHHWSQFINGTKGSGIMFTDSHNERLYYFDKMTASATGALKVSDSSERKIEFCPITLTTLYNFTSALDIMWNGAVVTFDGSLPIYKDEGGNKIGLWITVEYPPEITVSTES
jgi:hypothetical protein